MQSERRRAPRERHDSIVELYDEAGGLLEPRLRLIEFSARGARFASGSLFKVGQKVRLRLRLLKQGVVDAAAVVVWAEAKANATIYGVSFEAARPDRAPGSTSPSNPRAAS